MTDQPTPDRINDLMYGFWQSKALFTGVELGLFDELAGGPAGAEVLAVRLRLDPGATARLLNALVGLRLLTKTDGVFALTPEAATYLVRGRPHYLGSQMEHLSRLHWRLWQYLPDAIREGTPRMKQALGPGYEIFEVLYQDPQWLRVLIQGMHTLTAPSANEVVDAFDFTGRRLLVDVGGGSGALAIAAAQRYPELRAVVLDLPSVCAIAADYIAQQGLSDRVRTQSGDFFNPDTLPKDADAMALMWVLHDWKPREVRAILRNCYEALQSGGVLLVGEKLLSEDRTSPLATTLVNLHLLVSTGGEEHTAAEYRAWMQQAGFADIEVRLLQGNRDLIIGYKP